MAFPSVGENSRSTMRRPLRLQDATSRWGTRRCLMGILTDQNTTIVVQGITGREASILVKDSLDYGARILAGVTPGKVGQHVCGVMVWESVRRAVEEHGVHAGVLSVGPVEV